MPQIRWFSSGIARSINLLIYLLTLCKKIQVKADIALPGNPISELRDVTCHMGSQCYLLPDTSECARLTPSMQAGT